MKTKHWAAKAAVILFLTLLGACKKDKAPAPEKPAPTIENIEVGLSNNEMGITGRDFHFNADILAGDKIDTVQVRILPIATETYAAPWRMEQTWTEFRGAKNANVHKHFSIPIEAVEGKYDFIIRIKDQNGTVLQEKRKITIIKPENLPIDPVLQTITVQARTTPLREIFRLSNGSGDKILNLNDPATALVQVKGIKGDGKTYVVLVHKKHNHRPESVEAIDYSKTIVWRITEHKNLTTTTMVSNYGINLSPPAGYVYEPFTIGAAMDNNLPTPNPITGAKAWEAGSYYLGVLYQNSTYKVNLFHYIELNLKM